MKNLLKKQRAISIIAMLVVSMFVVGASSVSAWTPPTEPPYTWIWVENYTVVDDSDLTGHKFNISVNIENVSRLAGWQFRVDYNTTLLNATWCYLTSISSQYSSALLPAPWSGTKGIVDPMGFVTFGATYPNDPDSPYSGSGSLLDIEFMITLAPPYGTTPPAPANITFSCVLEITTQALDSISPYPDYDITSIDHGLVNGSYAWTRPQKQVGAPTAVASVYPSTQYVCDNVTLDGSASDDGGASPLYYAWDIGSDGSYEFNSTNAIVSIHCDTPGTYNVTLTVTNGIGMSDSDGPVFWDCIEKLGPIIDLYTSTNRWCGLDTDPDNVGKGKDMPCDALSPDVNITLFAEVTYNGAPVNHVFVAFEVLWEWEVDWYHQEEPWIPQNQCVLYATGETNKDGIATISFRVPTPCIEGLYIGKWLAYAKCKVQQVTIQDTMRFDVGYLIMLYDIETLIEVAPDDWQPGDTYVREEDCLGVVVYIKSISWIPRFAKFILVAYDECNVPLGQIIVGFTVPGGYYCDPMHGFVFIYDLCIPQWAYVGMGRVEVSVFTELPQNCGVPYSDSITAPITITWAGA